MTQHTAAPSRTCEVQDCDSAPRSKNAQWCAKHYHRWYRHGSPERTAHQSGVSASHGRRYRTTHRPEHPLAPPSGRVYVHRVVLYDRIGPGVHACHWCQAQVKWQASEHELELQVDHLNGIGDDNRSENLVPACPSCNTTRGAQARGDALRSAGWWSQHDTIAGLSNGGRRPRVAG